jgi:competence protein ComGC
MAGSRRGSAHRGLARASAFTLVEMLIAMVLTLILVLAIAEFYAVIGDAVKDGRATIEMGGQLRAVVQRLKADLDQLTVSVAPWTDDGSASGYFEYYEGRGNDYEPFAHIAPGSNPSFNMATGFVDLAKNGVTNGLGDGDDFLAFTIRSSGQPFTGRYQPFGATAPTIINSQFAEVIWWVAFEDINGNGRWDVFDDINGNNQWDANEPALNEPRQLYRRQLLIRPDLHDIYDNRLYSTVQEAHQKLLELWQLNDISLRIHAEREPGTNLYRYRILPNSLSDLARRENRFGHNPLEMQDRRNPMTGELEPRDLRFPHSATTTEPNFLGPRDPPDFPDLQDLARLALLMPSFTANSPGVVLGSQQTFVLTGTAKGEDLVLSNLLAFDVQAYDPYARVWPDNPGGASQAALTPSDPGYRSIIPAGPSILNPSALLGLGAYVDLNYYRRFPDPVLLVARNIDNNVSTSMNIPLPYFADLPASPPGVTDQRLYLHRFGYIDYFFGARRYDAYPYGATYDTWSVSYERDGINQLRTGSYDLQTNGVDDNRDDVVDDVGERETVPPYSQPLRGLRVRIRMYEPSTRQIRQATVETDFLRE